MNPKEETIQVHGYRIIRQIGEGGMSVVYLAYQESLKREVALKIMRPVIADESNVVKRFKQEAEIIAKLYHPNIVSIYDVGSVDKHTLFYAMPFLQNGDLTGFAYNNDEELIRLMSGLCQGFAYAHAQGVVHRDIKPENILFDQFGNVKIADFGIALSSGRRRFTKDQRIVGSIHYLSPEQAQSKHVDARSDIYGLGAILYEILTGKPVFDAPDDLAIMMAHVEKPIPKLPKKTAHWQPIIDRCLSKAPNQRFQSMPELQQAIESMSPQFIRGPIRQLQSLPYLLASVVLLLVVLGWWLWSSQDKEISSQDKTVKTQASETNKQPIDFITSEETESEADPANEPQTESENDMAEVAVFNPDPQLSEQQVSVLLNKARDNIDANQLTIPLENNALDKVLTVLADQPQHTAAKKLLSHISDGYYELSYQAILKKNYAQAETFADSVSTVRHQVALVDESLLQYLNSQSEMTVSLLLGALSEQVRSAVASNNRPLAQRLIVLTDELMPGHKILAELNRVLTQMPQKGQIVSDKQGLDVVLMTPIGQQGINYGFYVTPTEITVGQYRQFMQQTNHLAQRCRSQIGSNLIFSGRDLDNIGFAIDDDMPVVCVTWQDANDYATWISEQSGHRYRLPTKTEWNLIVSQTDKPNQCGQQNVAGLEFPDKQDEISYHACNDGFPRLAPVRAFSSEGLGLYGIYGNAKEWLSGCKQPGKIKSFFSPDKPCDENPVIGLSWLSNQQDTGSLKYIDYGEAYTHVGFRLVRQ